MITKFARLEFEFFTKPSKSGFTQTDIYEIEERLWMSKKILIIDDDPNVVDYLEVLFQDNGYTTFSAGDAQEGFDTAKRETPDMITLDIEMPGDWGPRFYRKMSREKFIKNTPVMVISGLSGSKYAVGKAVASISKPFDRDEVLKIVRDTIG